MLRAAALVMLGLGMSACASNDSRDGGACPAPTCPAGDMACGMGTVCVGGGVVYEYVSACLPTCNSTSDCASGRCAILLGDVGKRVCVTDTAPAACPGLANTSFSCPSATAYCFTDGKTLIRPFASPSNRLCAYEAVLCANGCVSTQGSSDLAVGAACR